MNNRIILLLLLVLPSFASQAQQQGKAIYHYLFPEFTKGTVLLKNGTKNDAMLNYNAATEEMVFDQNGQKLAFAETTLNQLDTVFIQDRKFILLDNKKIVEVFAQGRYNLFVQYKCKITPPGKPAPYGGTSQTSSTTSYSSWSGDGVVYKLELPNDYKVRSSMVYWFDNGTGLKSFSSLGQIKKYYNKQKEAYNIYTKEHKINFVEPATVAGLIQYMEANRQ